MMTTAPTSTTHGPAFFALTACLGVFGLLLALGGLTLPAAAQQTRPARDLIRPPAYEVARRNADETSET